MRVILTHEQADFDAVASQLGLFLLDEACIPVLPRKMNRNLRSFLTLYGPDLPFVETRDLPSEAIEQVSLVDTQSLPTLRGMGRATRVEVIDHHQRREATPSEWQVNLVELGAVTTYFVELLRERGETLSTLQATLLLLGIYEDTGALTYSRTTARDAHAVAFLLEQGADLKIAARFLNPPLSQEQRAAYDTLVEAAETHEIHDQRIVLSCADLPDLREEISTLAHKLRDLLDPDALFVLVQTGEGVRLVARSTSDQVDVSAIAAHFKGGGHDRAAAALIKTLHAQPGESLLAAARRELLDLLPRQVRSAISVSKLMSRRPRTIPPETSAANAAKLMQKYGYEGFPVVQEGRVQGLLTRRAVDRALSHNLDYPASRLMEAGDVSVQPGDSLTHLQKVMIESGWGQIPVVDENRRIIGIVTRTDLLKTLARRSPHASRHHNLAEKLEKNLPPDRLALVRAVAEQALALHLPVYIVGGFVRDLLLERPSLDFDIVVEGDAIALAKALVERHGGKATSHSRFGTAKWNLEYSGFDTRTADTRITHIEYLDLISSRREFYERPTALPTVERGSIKLDLHRRDFTLNTLALRLDGRHFGELHDYYGGLPDLERGLIRVLHSLSFIDDPTRMLRAVRFEQRFDFQIEPRTLQLMDEARPMLRHLSPERLRHELDLILEEPRAVRMLSRLEDLGLLKSSVDVLPWNSGLAARLESALAADPSSQWGLGLPVASLPFRQVLAYLLWLSPLPRETLEKIQARLVFPLAIIKNLLAASALLRDLPHLDGAKPSAWVRRLDEAPLLAVYAAWWGAETSQAAPLLRYAETWRHIHPKTDGDALKALGLPPGPRYQQILWQLRAAWLDGQVTTGEQEQHLLARLLQE
jgi:tRNA nucleotidyltransferase (CCA-adding enzyme)